MYYSVSNGQLSLLQIELKEALETFMDRIYNPGINVKYWPPLSSSLDVKVE